jgi:hypothetical protein
MILCKKVKAMDVVKFKITPKTIKIEVRNTNYVFDFNSCRKWRKVIEIVVELYNALEL